MQIRISNILIKFKMKKTLIRLYNWIRIKYLFAKRAFITPKIPLNPNGEIFINVGCGVASGKEYVNIDTLPFPNIHYVTDIKSLPMFKNECASIVYASHVVEHIPRHELNQVLAEWFRVLKKGGVFRMSVPDFDNLIKIYHASNNQIESVLMQVMGQNPPYNNHYSIWNFAFAEKLLKEIGFREVRMWDPKNVDHHDFKDRSSRVLEAGDVAVPLSLNVEAVK